MRGNIKLYTGFLLILFACEEAPEPVNISLNNSYSVYNGKTYCLTLDMKVWNYLGETFHENLDRYYLAVGDVVDREKYQMLNVSRGTSVTFREVWTFDDTRNKDRHGWVWFLGEVHDGVVRDHLVDLSALLERRVALAEFSPKINEKIVEECRKTK